MAHKKNTTNLTEGAADTLHGGRGGSAAGRREKSAHGRQERLPQRSDARTGGSGSLFARRVYPENEEAGA